VDSGGGEETEGEGSKKRVPETERDKVAQVIITHTIINPITVRLMPKLTGATRITVSSTDRSEPVAEQAAPAVNSFSRRDPTVRDAVVHGETAPVVYEAVGEYETSDHEAGGGPGDIKRQNQIENHCIYRVAERRGGDKDVHNPNP